MTDLSPSDTVSIIAARDTARRRFGQDADLDAPDISAWIAEYARDWQEGVRRTRDGLARIMREPNAWANWDVVNSMFLHNGADAEAVIVALRAIRRADPIRQRL